MLCSRVGVRDFVRSDDHHALLAVDGSSSHTTVANVRSDELLVESVGVRVVNVVIDTSLVVEASGLPELLHVAVSVVVVQEELRDVADKEEAKEVSLEASEQGLDVRAELGVALVSENLPAREKNVKKREILPFGGSQGCHCREGHRWGGGAWCGDECGCDRRASRRGCQPGKRRPWTRVC